MAHLFETQNNNYHKEGWLIPESMKTIESIEHATLKAIKPAKIESLPGWLVPLDFGNVNRANSAVPLQHQQFNVAQVKPIENIFGSAGLTSKFRLPLTEQARPFIAHLESLGYVKSGTTFVQNALVAQVLENASQNLIDIEYQTEVCDSPDIEWPSLFDEAGKPEGYGLSRVQVMHRADSGRYFSTRHNRKLVACGMAAFDDGWASVHGMRTRAEYRRRGLASEIIRNMMLAAQNQAITQTFLQVEADNTGAQAVYQRLGYRNVWTYAYWSKPIITSAKIVAL
jgi:N-acetylglutamate synthase